MPIYWIILGVGPKGAVPLSKATILGGAIGNFVELGWSRHPKAERPMIDYEASTFMQARRVRTVVRLIAPAPAHGVPRGSAGIRHANEWRRTVHR